tara:strand:+ start:12551 stop:12982 length:432 start_codon:yes stop_codon:yes gene_type:complete
MTFSKHIIIIFGGTIFGFGLAYSGAAIPEVVLSFLRLEDLGLAFVIGGALLITWLAFQFIPQLVATPLLGGTFTKAAKLSISKWNVIGASVFGVGWGLTGLCPGTSFAAVGMGNWPVLAGVVGMFIGAYVYGTFRNKGLSGIE